MSDDSAPASAEPAAPPPRHTSETARQVESTWFAIGRLEHDIDALRSALAAADEDRAPGQQWTWSRFGVGFVVGLGLALLAGWLPHLLGA